MLVLKAKIYESFYIRILTLTDGDGTLMRPWFYTFV